MFGSFFPRSVLNSVGGEIIPTDLSHVQAIPPRSAQVEGCNVGGAETLQPLGLQGLFEGDLLIGGKEATELLPSPVVRLVVSSLAGLILEVSRAKASSFARRAQDKEGEIGEH